MKFFKSHDYIIIASLPKFKSYKLNRENKLYQYPISPLGDNCFLVSNGWKAIGWCEPPYGGSGKHAIVFENGNKVYWIHGNIKDMKVFSKLPNNLKDELGPWL